MKYIFTVLTATMVSAGFITPEFEAVFFGTAVVCAFAALDTILSEL